MLACHIDYDTVRYIDHDGPYLNPLTQEKP